MLNRLSAYGKVVREMVVERLEKNLSLYVITRPMLGGTGISSILSLVLVFALISAITGGTLFH